ncbi:hypothetical protein ACFFX0_24015 [Citricoccus parietis]|uniref:Uncharacterized protein n=1 Tax=Citricoccus parietis TaxID=592307 RepID=A0ABV5G5C2_9MICC
MWMSVTGLLIGPAALLGITHALSNPFWNGHGPPGFTKCACA